jgi:FkbM family methyltransferase
MFLDEFGRSVDMRIEEMSRQLCQKYVKPGDHVLEFGARYGTVSVFLSKMLTEGKQLVSVEPDPNVWKCLEENRDRNGASFHIIKGVVSEEKQYLVHHPGCVWEQKTYRDPTEVPLNRPVSDIPNFTVEQLEQEHGLHFNVLVADCEGYLIEFYEKHSDFIARLDVLIYEEDCVSWHPVNGHFVDYGALEQFLVGSGFSMREDLVDHIGLHNKVWVKDSIAV